jgi:hypothetical protein
MRLILSLPGLVVAFPERYSSSHFGGGCADIPKRFALVAFEHLEEDRHEIS